MCLLKSFCIWLCLYTLISSNSVISLALEATIVVIVLVKLERKSCHYLIRPASLVVSVYTNTVAISVMLLLTVAGSWWQLSEAVKTGTVMVPMQKEKFISSREIVLVFSGTFGYWHNNDVWQCTSISNEIYTRLWNLIIDPISYSDIFLVIMTYTHVIVGSPLL